MMKFPKCISLTVSFNEHAGLYQTAEEWLADNESLHPDGPRWDWVSPEEREKAIRENSVWTLQWYPDTPVGFCMLAAASFDVLMAAAQEQP